MNKTSVTKTPVFIFVDESTYILIIIRPWNPLFKIMSKREQRHFRLFKIFAQFFMMQHASNYFKNSNSY